MTTLSPQNRLRNAVTRGDAEAYFQALEEGADPHARYSGNQDLIDVACQAASMHDVAPRAATPDLRPAGDHLEIVEHLVRHVGLVPDTEHTGLLSAARTGHADLVRLLARLGFDPRGFDDRALVLATEADLRDRTSVARPTGVHRSVVQALLDLGCRLDSGKGMARQNLTKSLMAEANARGVSSLDLPTLNTVWSNAERLGITLDANDMLGRLVMQGQSSLRTRREDTGRDVDDLAVELVDALVARGGWTDSKGQPGHGPHGPFVQFAAKNGLIALLDRFVALGADPRANGDLPLLNAAMANQRAMVNHLVERHEADLGGLAGQIRVQLRETLNETWNKAASASDLASMQADDAQAHAWGVELPVAHVFHLVTCNKGADAQACETWLADRATPASWEEALRTHVAMGLPERAQAWLDRLTANGQPLGQDLQETLVTLAARKHHTDTVQWLVNQGLDLLVHGPVAVQDLEGSPNRGHEPTIQWLNNQIEQEQLRREIQAVETAPSEPSVRRRL